MHRPQHTLRRFAAPIAASLLAINLVACAAPAPEAPEDKPVVLTTFTILQDIAQNVAGDHLHVTSITKHGAEIHHYEPTPSDIRRAVTADLILDNGLNLEMWFEKFVEDLDVPHRVVTEGIEVMSIAEDTYEGLPNPHAWMSPLNVKIYVDNMVDAFIELDPEHAEDFVTNGDAYKQQLQEVQEELVAGLSALPEQQRQLVTCEGAFSYLARDAGLTEQYIWAVNAEQQATPKQIAAVIETVREDEVPAVFCESTVSDKPMQQVVEATDAEYGGMLYVDSLSAEDGPVPTYLDLMRYDADMILEALTRKQS